MGFKDIGNKKEEDNREIKSFEDWNNENYDDTLEEITRYSYMEYDNRREEYLSDKTIRHE